MNQVEKNTAVQNVFFLLQQLMHINIEDSQCVAEYRHGELSFRLLYCAFRFFMRNFPCFINE